MALSVIASVALLYLCRRVEVRMVGVLVYECCDARYKE